MHKTFASVRLMGALVVAAIPVGLLAACASAPSEPRSYTDSCRQFSAERTETPALFAAALESSFQHQPGWAGVEIQRDPNAVVVHYVGTPPECIMQATTVHTTEGPTSSPSTTARVFATRIKKVKYTLADLDAIVDRITRDRAALQNQGLQLTGWGSDVVKNRVVVHLTRHTAEMANLLRQRYGNVVVVGADITPSPS